MISSRFMFFNGDEGLLLSKENSRYSEIKGLGCIFKRNHGKNRVIYPREISKSQGLAIKRRRYWYGSRKYGSYKTKVIERIQRSFGDRVTEITICEVGRCPKSLYITSHI